MGLQKKVGYKIIKASTSFTRPTDTTAYDIGDAISNSTSAPTVFQIDLAPLAAFSQEIEIMKIAVVSSVKQGTLPLVNVFLSTTTFTATNDNSALSIADTTMEAGGAFINLTVQNSTAANAVVAASNLVTPLILESNSTKLFGTLQAANAYTPVSGEKFTIIVWAKLI